MMCVMPWSDVMFPSAGGPTARVTGMGESGLMGGSVNTSRQNHLQLVTIIC